MRLERKVVLNGETIEAVKKKIVRWLSEENYRVEEISDPHVHFNLVAYVSEKGFNILQNKVKMDSFIIGTNLNFTPEQIAMYEKMDGKRRQRYFWTLRMMFLRSANIGDFALKPNPPKKLDVVFIASRPIFYEALTKERLINALYDVYRSVMMVIWLLEEFSGSISATEISSMYIA